MLFSSGSDASLSRSWQNPRLRGHRGSTSAGSSLRHVGSGVAALPLWARLPVPIAVIGKFGRTRTTNSASCTQNRSPAPGGAEPARRGSPPTQADHHPPLRPAMAAELRAAPVCPLRRLQRVPGQMEAPQPKGEDSPSPTR